MRIRVLQAVVWAVCAAPAVILLYRTFVTGDLGVNPVETLQHETGRPALQILLATLAITPLRRLFGWHSLIRVRRLLGLWAFFYAVAHFTIYLVFDRFFSISGIIEDVVLRKFVLSGMVSLLALLPLALTSTKGWIRRLGGKRWRKLHQLVYLAAIAGALHFIWKEKVLTTETITYFVLVTVLVGFRVVGTGPRFLNAMVGVMKGMLCMPLLPRAWVVLLAAVNMASIAFIGHREAQVVLVAMMFGGMAMAVVYAKLGFVRLLGVGHFHWMPMLVWLYGRLDGAGADPAFYYWILALIAINGASLAIDIVDVGRYLAGEREPTLTV